MNSKGTGACGEQPPQQNVAQERYVQRADNWKATWGKNSKPDGTCAECGADVIYNPTHGEGEVTLICLECMVLRPA